MLEALAESVTGSARASLLISSGDAALKGDEEPTAERRFRLAQTAAPDDSSALIRLLRLSSVLENVEDALQLFELLYEQLAGDTLVDWLDEGFLFALKAGAQTSVLLEMIEAFWVERRMLGLGSGRID